MLILLLTETPPFPSLYHNMQKSRAAVLISAAPRDLNLMHLDASATSVIHDFHGLHGLIFVGLNYRQHPTLIQMLFHPLTSLFRDTVVHQAPGDTASEGSGQHPRQGTCGDDGTKARNQQGTGPHGQAGKPTDGSTGHCPIGQILILIAELTILLPFLFPSKN